ncbi:MAG: HAD family hydrolase [Lachnospiraceae bacterium]|nr:HAD family hydrolase [Lachnospiraceae bacterium]
MQRIVLFDLDGTLTDPGLGITNSVIYALDKFGILVEDRSELYKFIGPPLLNSFMDFYGFDEEKANQAVIYYRELYNVTGKYENEVYEGVEEMLQTLKEQGLHLLVATSKPEYLAKDILEHFSLSQYFCVIAGSDLEGERNTKGKVIDYALKQYAEQYNVAFEQVKQNAIMVGDRFHDIYGAKENGIQSIAVLYGYGNEEEFKQAGADYIATTPMDIVCMLQRKHEV